MIPRQSLRPHTRRIPLVMVLRRIAGVAATAPLREPSPGDQRILASVLDSAFARFGDGRWTVAHLVDLGDVDPAESRSIGRMLARYAGRAVRGFELIADGECRDGRRWRVRVSR